MVVLPLKKRQKIQIGNDIVIEIVSVGIRTVRIGITAPREIPIRMENAVLSEKLEPGTYVPQRRKSVRNK